MSIHIPTISRFGRPTFAENYSSEARSLRLGAPIRLGDFTAESRDQPLKFVFAEESLFASIAHRFMNSIEAKDRDVLDRAWNGDAWHFAFLPSIADRYVFAMDAQPGGDVAHAARRARYAHMDDGGVQIGEACLRGSNVSRSPTEMLPKGPRRSIPGCALYYGPCIGTEHVTALIRGLSRAERRPLRHGLAPLVQGLISQPGLDGRSP
jgi:hypothetical protein